jgi:hypothetical protein
MRGGNLPGPDCSYGEGECSNDVPTPERQKTEKETDTNKKG